MNEQSTTVTILDKIKEITDGGGFKGILMRFVMYFLLPLFVIIGLGYLAYYMYVLSKRSYIRTGTGVNESSPYHDGNVGIQIKVVDVKPSVSADTDAENFRKIQERLKSIYGVGK